LEKHSEEDLRSELPEIEANHFKAQYQEFFKDEQDEVKRMRVVARITALPDQVNKVRTILSELIEPTRGEAGCISYELLQNNSDPTDFTFVEEWESQSALDAHLGSAHVQKAIAATEKLLAMPPDIRRYSLLF
jgi:quinol monooxygenase YgiN